MTPYQIVEATQGWVWVSVDNDKVQYEVVCWKLNNLSGETIGLISIEAPDAKTKNNVTRLVEPPPIPGKYIKK